MAWNCGNNTPWPDTWVAVLKLMHPTGYSASRIATHINAKFRGANLSRNAVIGKVHRLGLERDEAHSKRNRAGALEKGRPKRTWCAKDVTLAAPKPSAARQPSVPSPPPPPPRIPTVHVSTITGAIIPGPSPLPPQPLPAPAAVTGQPITIFEITAHNCCWPINAGRPEWLFCGHPRDPKSGVDRERGYCTAHWRKSLQRRAA
jgi:hypothetical protein